MLAKKPQPQPPEPKHSFRMSPKDGMEAHGFGLIVAGLVVISFGLLAWVAGAANFFSMLSAMVTR